MKKTMNKSVKLYVCLIVFITLAGLGYGAFSNLFRDLTPWRIEFLKEWDVQFSGKDRSQSERVVYAQQVIPAGTKINSSMLIQSNLQKNNIPANAIMTTSQADGKTAARDIKSGAMIMNEDLR